MKKLILLLLLTLTSTLNAKMVDGVALIVEGEAITTAEIRAIVSQMHISKTKATDLLIQDRLQKVAMKDIIISEKEIDSKIEEIAKQNNISLKKMQKILKAQGTPWVEYRNGIRESLKQAHFYQDKVVASTPEPTQDELKLFYHQNKSKFTIARTLSMTEYSAKNEKDLQNFIKSSKRKSKHVHIKHIKQQTKKLSTEMLALFLQTPKNHYTKIMNAGDRFIAYKIHAHYGKRNMSFEVAQNAVLGLWKKAQQTTALKDYFQKLRTSADIQRLR